MKTKLFTFLLLIVFCENDSAIACTGFTASNDSVVLVGNNEDWWQSDPQILFFPPTPWSYGYVGLGFQYSSDYWHTFGAVNDQGLFHDAFSVPSLQPTKSLDKPYYNGNLIALAMEMCATVQEVVELYNQYNMSFMVREQHFYVDRSGTSVIIEGDTVFYNNGDPQAIANFRFSNQEMGGWPSWRYDNAKNNIEGDNEVSVNHYRTILDLVHLNSYYYATKYSNINDLTNNVIYLFINHDFEKLVEIDIDEELKKGYRLVNMSDLQYSSLPPIHSAMDSPTFDHGILLVNGLTLSERSSEDGEAVWNSYESKAFWGDFLITFWDCSDSPSDGYPATLPDPIGHGQIPSDVLGRYSTIIWISNYNGKDVTAWRQTAILPYWEAGGNLIFMSRYAQMFIDGKIQDYLGITWGGDYGSVTINNCTAVYPGMKAMSQVLDQNYNALFNTVLQDTNRHLLFQDTSISEFNGVGIWYKPEEGGTFNEKGGQAVYIAGSPQRYDPDHLSSNLTNILENFFHESKSTDVKANSSGVAINSYSLQQNYPNPFNPTTTISFQLPSISDVTLNIYNINGQLVKTLISRRMNAGNHEIIWDGTDEFGERVGSGTYIYSLNAGDFTATRKILFLK